LEQWDPAQGQHCVPMTTQSYGLRAGSTAHLFFLCNSLCAERCNLNGRQWLVIVDSTERQKQSEKCSTLSCSFNDLSTNVQRYNTKIPEIASFGGFCFDSTGL
jgi:hypothetical protein